MLEPTNRSGRSSEEDSFIGFRVGVLLVMGLVLFSIIGFRLWYLQILSGDQFVANSVNNREREVIIEAPRGGIYDRNGVPLVQNRAGLSVGFLAMDMPDPGTDAFYAEIYSLSDILDLPPAQLLADYDKAKSEPHKTYVVKEDVDENTVVAYLEEHNDEYPGVEVEKAFLREYTHPFTGFTAGHILGFVGEISDNDLSQPEFAELKGGTHVGKDGVERQYDSYLRGRDGFRLVEVDATGKPVEVLKENPADTGYNLYLTIDAKVQAAAENALEEGLKRARTDVAGLGFTNAAAGAVVAMDPRNGEIVAMASYPEYDPEKWVGGISTVDFAAYNSPESNRPLYNRAMSGLYPAGSTFKPFVALAAMDAGLLTWDEKHDCFGRYKLPIGTGSSQTFQIWKCWVYPNGHKTVNLYQAIEQSCDFYFYNVGKKTYEQPTPVLQNGVRRFGFGRSTGIDLPGETESSVVPDKVWAREHGTEWKTGDEINLAIGQGYLQTTPLQLAVALSALVNGGTVWVPHIGLQITDSSNRVVSTMQTEKRSELGMKQEYIDVVKQGMVLVCNDKLGTAYWLWRNFSVDVAGKTGTSQVVGINLNGTKVDDYALFMGYAPANSTTEPQIVVVAVIEQGGHGSSVASPVVRRVMEAYFGLPRGYIPLTTVD
jgi:penicillin-binding protein 2